MDRMKVSPAGIELFELTLAVRQKLLGKSSVGYVECLFAGDKAIDASTNLKIGNEAELQCRVWSRQYVDRKGNKISETKFIVERFEKIKGDKKK